MTSRRILWTLLVLAALPPAFEATVGCSFEPGRSSGPILENAVSCACTLTEAGQLRQQRIQASGDDAEQTGATMDLTNEDIDLGDKLVGLRFDGIALPAGAMIVSAHVQFSADETQNQTTDLTIVAEASVAAATFSATDNDISGRTPGGASVAWPAIPAWTNGDADTAQQTPDLAPLLQELVMLPGWTSASPVVLRIAGTGHRTAESFDDVPGEAAQLVVNFDAGVTAEIDVCAESDERDATTGVLLFPAAECDRVEQTLTGMNQACGLPEVVSCELVDLRDPNDVDVDDSFQSDACVADCVEDLVDAPACLDYDPVAFAECIASGLPLDACRNLVAATNAPGGSPVCLTSGAPLAARSLRQASQCDVAGSSGVRVGDREPQQDPDTEGALELLGPPCPAGGCFVHPSFQVRMEPITFSVRWASDPTFGDLGAAGRGLETALVDTGLASFAADTVAGTGTGRRGGDGLAIDATNSDPLLIGVDWIGRTCTMDGTLSVGVGDDGLCEGDGATACQADSPDCDAVGGPCVFPPEQEEMSVTVALAGTLVNQPPMAVAGADQTIECTSTAGASFALNGRGSSDPDPNLTLASWREGSRTGPEISTDLDTVQTLGVGVSQSYVLRVIDEFAQLDEDTTVASVVDTTPPELTIAASPTTLWPPNHKLRPITVTVVTSDVCDASPTIRLLSITSNEAANGTGDGNTSSDVADALIGQDDREFKLRAERSGNGGGRVYTITYEATDDSGNATVRQTNVTVAHNQGG